VLHEELEDRKRFRPQGNRLWSLPEAFVRGVQSKSTERVLAWSLHHGNITATILLRYDCALRCPLFSTRHNRIANTEGKAIMKAQLSDTTLADKGVRLSCYVMQMMLRGHLQAHGDSAWIPSVIHTGASIVIAPSRRLNDQSTRLFATSQSRWFAASVIGACSIHYAIIRAPGPSRD
jgi:hypothetical protein